jgi:hypothetical protein
LVSSGVTKCFAVTWPGTTNVPPSWQLFGRASLAGIEPVGFRVKSDLRNHQAIVQPRLYDSLMVRVEAVPEFKGSWPGKGNLAPARSLVLVVPPQRRVVACQWPVRRRPLRRGEWRRPSPSHGPLPVPLLPGHWQAWRPIAKGRRRRPGRWVSH